MQYNELKFGIKLKQLRLSANLSQSKLAENSGFHKAAINRWESKGGNPSIKTLNKLAKALDIDFVEFFK